LELDLDGDGWNIALCDCGWQSPGCPDAATAAEVWGGHLADVVASNLREVDDWAYCVVHDECANTMDCYADDDGQAACRAWLKPVDDEVPCRFVPVLICEVQP
jgi:hypothetical protein